MKVYGNLMNRLEEDRQFCQQIEVGTGMTEYYWSDRDAYEVTRVIDQKHVYVREYDHKHIGEAYTNEWELVSNPDKPERLITKRGKYWYWTNTITAEEFNAIEDQYERFQVCMVGFDPEKIAAKGKQTVYSRANVSFGVASYYYDYEF